MGASKGRSVKIKKTGIIKGKFEYKGKDLPVHDIKAYVEFRGIVPLIINLDRICK